MSRKKTQFDYGVEELLMQERVYLDSLTLFVESFVPKFERYSTDPRVAFHQRGLTDENVATQLFGKFTELQQKHAELGKAFETRLRAFKCDDPESLTHQQKAQAFAEALASVAPYLLDVYSR